MTGYRSPMHRLPLTRAPEFVDDLGRPCFGLSQAKGLIGQLSDELLAAPGASGYCDAIDGPALREIATRVKLMAPGGALDVVEIGGTTGHLFDQIREVVGTYTNIEPGEPKVDRAMLDRLADDRYQAVRCSAEDLPIADGAVDLVLALASLDHIPDVDLALSEIRRVLRPGGSAIITLNNRGSWWKQMLSGTELLKARELAIAADHYFQWTATEATARLASHLTIREVTTRTFLPYLPIVWRAIMPIADFVGSRLAPLGGSITMIVARRDTSQLHESIIDGA